MLSGCFSPKFPEGLQCGTGSEPCPPGQVCNDGFCVTGAGSDGGVDTPIDPNDLDGDGFGNDEDNCPEHFNPGQYDEDFDVLGNACDPCPFTSDNLDSDADGVGDVCDPNPNVPGETITMFEGFDETLPPDWVVLGGWAQGPGELAFQLGNDEIAFVVPPVFSDGSGLTIAGFVADFVDPMFINKGAGVGMVDANGGGGVACTAIVSNADQSRHLSLVDNVTLGPIASTPAPWATSALNVLYNRQFDTISFQCTIAGSVSTGIGGSSSGNVPSTIGFGARSITGRYLWVMYVEVP